MLTAGFIHDLADTDYHCDPIESLSSTFARLLTSHVPAKALEVARNRKPTKAMNLGKAAHKMALGAGPELIVWEHDGRTKEGKAERAARAFDIESEAAVAVTAEERDHIEGMAKVLRADPTVSRLLDECLPEVSAYWQEGGIWCRARYDMLGALEAHDYKTTTDVSARGFSKQMANYGYHQQAEFYLRGLKALGHPAADRPLRFICQETLPPYLVQIHTPDDDAMDIARELNDRAIRIYGQALTTGEWAGYERLEADPTSLPAYYYFDLEDALPNEWRPIHDEMSLT